MSKLSRNAPCGCGSGKKYKFCCMNNTDVIDYTSNYDKISKDFINKDIRIDYPGFYDSEQFLANEKSNKYYLNNYARFVQTRKYEEDYLKTARNEIMFISKLLNNELVNDGRKRACIDVSMVLSKVLELEGYWNYMVKGALTLIFPPESGISNRHFWPIDTEAVDAAHVWLFAPPYNVLDITIKQQPYSQDHNIYIPDYVFEENNCICTVEPIDILCGQLVQELRRIGVSEKEMITFIDNKKNFQIQKTMKAFAPILVKCENITLKYITTGISAPECSSLDDIKSLNLNGRYGIQIYRDIIKPALTEYRLKQKN